MSVFNGDDELPIQPVPVPTPPDVPKQIIEQTPAEKLVPLQGNYDSVILDSQYKNLRTFLTHMDGMSVTIQYYNNMLGTTDIPDIVDIMSDTYLNQFRYIRNLQVRFQGDKSFSKSDDTGLVSITGSFNTYPGFTPSKYDLFTIEAGEGKRYLAYVEEANELAERRDRVCACTFRVIELLTPEIQQALDARVVDTYVFDKKLLSSTPIIKESLVVSLEKLRRLKNRLVESYIGDFYLSNISGLVLKETRAAGLTLVYDELTTNAFKALIPDYTKYSNLPINVFSSGYAEQRFVSLWDLLFEGNNSKFDLMKHNVSEHNKTILPFDLETHSLRVTPVDVFYFLTNVQNDYLDLAIQRPDKQPQLLVDGSESPADGFIGYIGAKYKKANENGFYVLSGAFYANDVENMSDLERSVHKLLNEEALEPNETLTIIEESYRNCTDYDRYFFIPVMLTLINAILR